MSETIYSEASFGKCPFFTAQKIFSGKWSVLIVHLLCEGPKRFGQLHRSLEVRNQSLVAWSAGANCSTTGPWAKATLSL